ncbi:MAG: AAA family ATPase, partial [Bacilli bacterium]
MEYKTRIIENEIKEKLEYMGGVAIRGPKWCSKTETAKIFSKDIIDLSNEEIKDNIYFQEKKYSKLFDKEKPLLIDEWQLYPAIWNSAKTYIDNAKVPGQF